MVETRKRDHMSCEKCGEAIKPDQECYQLRYGYIEQDGITFHPDQDVAYFCVECGVERGNYSS